MNDENERLIADLRATVDDALAQIDALLAEAGDAEPVQVELVEGRASPSVAVGGSDLDLAPRTGFLTGPWRDYYRPDQERGVYVACCSGLKRFEKLLGRDLAKPGTVGPDFLAQRLEQIRRDRTGSVFHDGERHLRSADGWTDWFARAIRPVIGPSPGSPVRVEDRLLTFRLPATLHWQHFDDRFDAKVREAALERWAMSEEGLALCAERDLPPRHLQRSTPYCGGVDVRLSPTLEICLLDPVTGFDRLIRIIEDVLLAHVLGGEG